jgi:hypothetical protein
MPMRQGENWRPSASRFWPPPAIARVASKPDVGSSNCLPRFNREDGTDYVLYRKDRVQCATGQEYLDKYRLKPDSPTRRVIATCCNSAMFLDFTRGHWLTMDRDRFPAGAPPLEMRIMTRDRRGGAALADDLPNYDGHPGKFMLRLIAAWIAMGLRRPEITFGKIVGKDRP